MIESKCDYPFFEPFRQNHHKNQNCFQMSKVVVIVILIFRQHKILKLHAK